MKVLAIFILLVCLCINPAFSNSSHGHLKKTKNGHEKLEILKKTHSKGNEENAIQISKKATISSIPGHNNVTEIPVAKQPEFGLESSSDDVGAKEDVELSNTNIRESKKLNHYYKSQNQQVEAQEESEEEKKQQQQSPVKESAVQEQDENDNLQKHQHQNEVQESIEEQQKEDNQKNQEQESAKEQQEESNQQNQGQKPVEEQQEEDNQQNQEQESVKELHEEDNQQNQEEPVEERQEYNQQYQEQEPVKEQQEEDNQQNKEEPVEHKEEYNQQNQKQETVKQLKDNQQNQEQEPSEKQRKEDNHHHLQQQSQVQESKEEELEKRDNQQLQLNMNYATKSIIQSSGENKILQPMKAEQDTTMKENTNKNPSKSEGDTTENEVRENAASDNYETLKLEKINSNLPESKSKQSENTAIVISSKNVKKVDDTVHRVTGKTQDKKHKNENLKQISDSQQKKEHEVKKKTMNKKHTQKQSFHPVARAKDIFDEQSKGTVKDSPSNEHFTNISNPEKTKDKSEGKKLVAVDNNLGNRVTKTDSSETLKPNIDEKLKNSEAPEKNKSIPSASTAKPTKINKDQGPEFIRDAIKSSLDAAKKSVQTQKAQKEAFSTQEPQTLKSKNEKKKEDELVEKLRKELDKEEEKLLTKEKTEQKSLIQSHHSKKKYSTALIVVSLTLIISTILLSIAGVYYRKISIDGRRYYGHTLLSTEEDISLYTASNYNEDTNRYESWNSS